MRFLAFIFAIIAFSNSVFAKEILYIPEDSIKFDAITPPIKVNGEEWQKEIEYIISLQKNPDENEIKESAAEMHLKPEMIAEFVVPQLNRDKFPATYTLLDRTAKVSKVITSKFKDHFNTKRPYIADKRVKALIKAHDNPAYPSGHTSGSYIQAYAQALLFPEKEKLLLERAEEIAQHRVLVGMHYPHDVEGGKELAELMFELLEDDEDFLQDLELARDEISKSGIN